MITRLSLLLNCAQDAALRLSIFSDVAELAINTELDMFIPLLAHPEKVIPEEALTPAERIKFVDCAIAIAKKKQTFAQVFELLEIRLGLENEAEISPESITKIDSNLDFLDKNSVFLPLIQPLVHQKKFKQILSKKEFKTGAIINAYLNSDASAPDAQLWKLLEIASEKNLISLSDIANTLTGKNDEATIASVQKLIIRANAFEILEARIDELKGTVEFISVNPLYLKDSDINKAKNLFEKLLKGLKV